MKGTTSVVIPCYNFQDYLSEALMSVKDQTQPVREVIVVDDGSSEPIHPPEGWKGPPLQVIRTDNHGLGAARNMGIRNSTGEFIAFLDADDKWDAKKIEMQERALVSDTKAVACYTRCVCRPGFLGFGPYPPLDVTRDDFLRIIWYQLFFPPSSVMVRRDALLRAGLFREDLGNGEDIELWLRLLSIGHFIQVPEPLCYYRKHQKQFTRDTYAKIRLGKKARAIMIKEHRDQLIASGIPQDRLWDAYRNDILIVYYRRDFRVARKLLWDYWFEHPHDLKIFIYGMVSLFPSALVTRIRGRIPNPDPTLENSSEFPA
jgi:glycosyltransferase involved in cell wall biosynthesis